MSTLLLLSCEWFCIVKYCFLSRTAVGFVWTPLIGQSFIGTIFHLRFLRMWRTNFQSMSLSRQKYFSFIKVAWSSLSLKALNVPNTFTCLWIIHFSRFVFRCVITFVEVFIYFSRVEISVGDRQTALIALNETIQEFSSQLFSGIYHNAWLE